MCNRKEKKPTEEQIRKIKFGYKVFDYGSDKELCPIFIRNFASYSNLDIEGFCIASGEISDSAGFHVFLYKKHAEILLEWAKKQSDRGSVIKKVEIKEIIAIGLWNDVKEINASKRNVVRCNKMKILDEEII